jgi:ribosomal protein L30/L7E
MSTNQALKALGLTKTKHPACHNNTKATIYRGEAKVFEGTLAEINTWLRSLPGCPAGF